MKFVNRIVCSSVQISLSDVFIDVVVLVIPPDPRAVSLCNQTCNSSRIQSETPAIALPNAWHMLETFALFSQHFCPYCTKFIYVIMSKNCPYLNLHCPICQSHSIAILLGWQVCVQQTKESPITDFQTLLANALCVSSNQGVIEPCCSDCRADCHSGMTSHFWWYILRLAD